MMSYKNLKNTERTILRELEILKKQSSKTNGEIVNKKKELTRIERLLKKERSKGIIITEHALLRYLERFKGLDVEALKKEILKDTRLVQAMETLGNGDFPIKGGILRVKDNTIITIIDK